MVSFNFNKKVNLISNKKVDFSLHYKETGVLAQNIGRCCIGKANTAGGYVWKYKVDCV